MTVEIKVTGAKEAADRLRRFSWTVAALRASDGTAPLVMEALRREAPFRTRGSDFSESAGPYRHLRDSISTVRHSSIGGTERVFVSDVPQAWYTIDGTRPHEIRPRPEIGRTPETPWRNPAGGARTVLSWIASTGERRFATSVQHPGTAPNPWNRRAAEAVMPVVLARYREEIRKELGG
ncbi:MAG: hypothetical protein V4472_25480 [Pseudomonadota bacterium]